MIATQRNKPYDTRVAESQDRALLDIPGLTRQPKVGTDSEYTKQGGWKVHLTVGPANYDTHTTLLKLWLHHNFGGTWKHLHGGEKYETDFTIYLGSRATLDRFVSIFEGSGALNLVVPSMAGSTDCIVGKSGKLAARFDTKGSAHEKGNFDYYGRAGIPIAYELAEIWAFGDKE